MCPWYASLCSKKRLEPVHLFAAVSYQDSPGGEKNWGLRAITPATTEKKLTENRNACLHSACHSG